MPKLKKVRSGKFTLIQNLIFEDHRLSYKEIGIYCNMMKFPDDWEFSIRYLAERHKDKRDSVRTGIEKLIEYGYIARSETQHRDERGFYGKYDYIIYEDPLDNPYFIPCPQISEGLTSADLDRCTDFPTTDEKPCTDFPTTDFPHSDDPLTENPTTTNTFYTDTVSTNTFEPNIEDDDASHAREDVDLDGFKRKLMNIYMCSYSTKSSKPEQQREMMQCFNAIVNAISEITDPVAIAAINDCSREEAKALWEKVYHDLFSTELGGIVRDDVRHKHNYLIKLIANEFKTGFGPDPINSSAFGIFSQE
jgi:predicted transcriptional regulator